MYICPMDSHAPNANYLREPVKITHTLCTHLSHIHKCLLVNLRRRAHPACVALPCIIHIGFEFGGSEQMRVFVRITGENFSIYTYLLHQIFSYIPVSSDQRKVCLVYVKCSIVEKRIYMFKSLFSSYRHQQLRWCVVLCGVWQEQGFSKLPLRLCMPGIWCY